MRTIILVLVPDAGKGRGTDDEAGARRKLQWEVSGGVLERIPGLKLGGRSSSVAEVRQNYILGGDRESGIL